MQNAEHDAPRLADTPLGQFVRVELIPDSPVEFTVVPLSDTEQPVLRAELTQWEWLVTPRQVGLRKRLRVRATNIVDVGGQRLTKSHPARTLEVDVTVEAAAIPGSGEVSTAMVRKLLDEALPSDATLESFCLDYLPQVYLRFGGGMERMQKVTLLLSVASPRQVLERLCEAEPDKVEELLAKLPPATVQPPTPSATLLSVPLPTQMPAAAPPIAPAPVPLASAREAARHDVQALPAQQLDPRPPSAQPGAATQQAADTDVAQRWRRLVILLLGLLLTLAAIGIYRCAVHVP